MSVRPTLACALGRVEILRGAVTRYEVLGGLLGAISLTAVGLIVEEERDCFDCLSSSPGTTSTGYCPIGAAAPGLVLGMLVGASIDRDRWEAAEVPVSALREQPNSPRLREVNWAVLSEPSGCVGVYPCRCRASPGGTP